MIFRVEKEKNFVTNEQGKSAGDGIGKCQKTDVLMTKETAKETVKRFLRFLAFNPFKFLIYIYIHLNN